MSYGLRQSTVALPLSLPPSFVYSQPYRKWWFGSDFFFHRSVVGRLVGWFHHKAAAAVMDRIGEEVNKGPAGLEGGGRDGGLLVFVGPFMLMIVCSIRERGKAKERALRSLIWAQDQAEEEEGRARRCTDTFNILLEGRLRVCCHYSTKCVACGRTRRALIIINGCGSKLYTVVYEQVLQIDYRIIQ